jgi:hypothetical protein
MSELLAQFAATERYALPQTVHWKPSTVPVSRKALGTSESGHIDSPADA